MPQNSSTLLLGGRVHSPTHPDATAMVVRDGIVAWLGSDDVGRAQFPEAEVVTLDGAFVAPGFVDSHIHLTATGLTLTGLDPTATLTADQLADARLAALDAAAAAGVVAVHDCAGPNSDGALEDWRQLCALGHGVEVIGYWGQAVRSAAEARAVLDETGARGLAGDLCVDGSFGSRTALLHQPYADAPDRCGTGYLASEPVVTHLRACTEAGVTAGFHVTGDAAVSTVIAAFERVVQDFGVVAVARCGHRLEHLAMVTHEQAAKLGSWGVIASVQPNVDAQWGGDNGMYARRLGRDRARRLNNFALLASAGVPLALGSDAPMAGLDPWLSVRAAANHHTPASAVSVRAAFAAATRGGWRAAGIRDGLTGMLVPGAPASYAVWDAGELEISAPRNAVQRWSTDPRSRVPALPRLSPDAPLPRCRQTVHRGAVIYG